MDHLIIAEDSSKNLSIHISTDHGATKSSGQLRRGIGRGEGFWYADLKYQSNSKVFGSVRLKELGNDEVDICFRAPPLINQRLPWSNPCTVAKDPQVTLPTDTFTLDVAIKQAKLKMKNLSSMYVFAKVAESKKLFEQREMDWADSVHQMLIESVQNTAAFNEWHKKLAPQPSFARIGSSNDVADLGKLKKLIQEEIGKGALKEPHYIRTLQTYKDQLLSKLDESIWQMSEQMFSTLGQQVSCQKKRELEEDWRCTLLQLESSRRDAYSLEIQSLAPENAMSLTLTKLVSRGYSGNYRLSYEKEVEGSPKLCCTLQNLTVEKQLFEQAVAGEHEFQIELETFAGSDFSLDVQDPADVHMLGSLTQDRVFWISSHEIPCGGKGIKFHCQARGQPPKELLTIKRPARSVAFNETLRMLALYNESSKVVVVYAWNEVFTHHSDFCAPIQLDAYVQDADLIQMHFLPASKQLCFVLRNNMVKVYELIAKTIRPRGFSIPPHTKTFVDSTGAALMVLRRKESAWVVDVFLVADGREVKTLPLPVALSEDAPVVDILRLYGVDFLVAVDEAKTLHGWRFHLQTAEQVCSMEQLGEKAMEPAKSECTGAACFDILYQVLAKFTNHPALGGDFMRQVTRLTVVGPAVESNVGVAVERYVAGIVGRLKQETQKPSLDSLKLDTCLALAMMTL